MLTTNNGKFSPEYGGKLASSIALGPFQDGIDNYSNVDSIGDNSLLDALNVDIYNDGTLKQRSGYKRIETIEYSNLSNFTYYNNYFVLKGSDLYIVNLSNLEERLIYPSFGYNKVYYLLLNDEVYISNSFKSIIYSNKNNSIRNWKYDSPESVSYTINQGTGYLKKGKYKLNYSLLYGKYESSISLTDVEVEIINDNSEIVINVENNESNTGFATYLSDDLGSTFFFQGNSNSIKTFVNNTKQPKKGAIGFPALKDIQIGFGRIWGISGNALVFSDALDFHQYTVTNHIEIDNTKIVLLNVLNDRIFIGTQRGIYSLVIEGFGNGQQSLVKISEDIAVEGSLFNEKLRNIWGFITVKNGLVVYEDGLSYKNDRVKLPEYSLCNNVILNKPGLKQVIFNFADEDVKMNSLSIKDFDSSYNKLDSLI